MPDFKKRLINCSRLESEILLFKSSIKYLWFTVSKNFEISMSTSGIVIDLSRMKGIRIHPVRHTRAEPGLTWAEFDRETQAFGLALPGGIQSTTGIAGFTVGGGFGCLSRKYGLTVDNLLSADVVTADGRLLIVSKTENSDLFWGISGGGGNFGIVTSFEYGLQPVGPVVLGGMLLHPLSKAKEVLGFFRDYVAKVPEELSIFLGFVTMLFCSQCSTQRIPRAGKIIGSRST